MGVRLIGFIGGSGPEARGLALRLSLQGESVMLGSRSAQRAQLAANGLLQHATSGSIAWGTNEETAAESDIVFISVPFSGHASCITSLRKYLSNKIIVDVVVPISFSRGHISVISVPEGSAAMQAQTLLPESTVVSAFHSISANDLLVPNKIIDSDVVVCSDNPSATSQVIGITEKISGIRGIDGGPLENSRYVEHFTAVLLNINKIYTAHSSIRIMGVNTESRVR